MTGLVRKATFLSVCGLLIAGSAMAFVPSPVTSTVPCGINLVGWNSTVADPTGNFTIVVKDIAGNVVPNSPIIVDFTACCNDIRVAGTQHSGSLTLDGTKKKVLGTTNGSGVLTMSIMGMAAALRPAPTNARGAGVNNGCADLYASGQLLTPNHIQVGTFDEDGAAGGLGVTGADFSVFLGDWLPGIYYQRGDYNYGVTCSQSPGITGADFSVFLGVWLGPGSSSLNVAPTATCP
jgi:hypothetical protein